MAPPPDPHNPFADVSPAVPNGTIYDFANLLTAPAVQETAAREGRIQVVNIPDAVIPSPLAEGITPGTLLQIKEYLVGKGDRPVKIADGYGGNGHEVWASWKRAWDLWNNHYIEGRVNPVWIAEEFPKKKKAMEEDDLGAERRARDAARMARRNNPTNLPPRPPHTHQRRFPLPGVSPFDPPQPAMPPAIPLTNQATVTIQDTTGPAGTMSGSLHHRTHSLGEPPRPAAPGKKWEVRKTISTRPAGSKLSTMERQAMSSKSFPKRRMKSGVGEVEHNYPQPREVGGDPTRIMVPRWETVESEKKGDLSEEYDSEDDSTDEVEWQSEIEEFEIKQWVEVDDPNSKRHRTVSSNIGAANQRSSKRVKFIDGEEPTGSELVKGFISMPSPQKKIITPRRQKPAAQRDSSPVRRTSPRKQVHSHAHNGAPTNPAMIPMLPPSSDIAMGGTEVPTSQRVAPSTFVFDPNEIINPPDPNDLSTNPFAPMHMDDPPRDSPPMSHIGKMNGPDEGRSGGWVPIKDLPRYKMPTDPGLPSDDPAQIDYDNLVFEDNVENSVWMPRRVGEKIPKIDIDDDDRHKPLGVSDLELDGGIDCGKEPYQVLRSMMEYVVRPDGLIKKMKLWDGVTGTIFNIPTKPLDIVPESDDPKVQLIKHVFSDPYRDEKLKEGPVFPLDIRRVQRVRETPLTSTPLLEDGEITLISRDFNPSAVPQRHMGEADPYWVTEEQKKLRDNPTRRWPPGPDKHGANLPTNDKIWKDEITINDHYDARYFVTNLQGGTLLVNGQQVRKGYIAGPLPSFAVIECPGGQVAFWWGTDGRNYKASHNLDTGDHEKKWETLRRTKGFEFAGMPAGRVWDMKIADRVRRERTGDDQDDDEQWKCWKNTKKAQDRLDEVAVFQLYEEPRFAEKDHADIELKWALARLHRRIFDPDVGRPSIIFPESRAFWPGSIEAHDADDAPPKPISRDDIENLWTTHRENVEMRQGMYLEFLKTGKEQEARQRQLKLDSELRASNKRKADGLFNPMRKRLREEREATIQKGIDERQKRAAESINAENKAIARENARVRMLQDEAKIAAAIKAELERNSAATHDTIMQKLQEDEMTRRAQEGEKRRQLNMGRALRNQPLLPPRAEFEMMKFGNALRNEFMPRSELTEAGKLQVSAGAEEAEKRAQAAMKWQVALEEKRKEEEAKRTKVRAEAIGITKEPRDKKYTEEKAARDAEEMKEKARLEDERFNKERLKKQVMKEENRKLLGTDTVQAVVRTAARFASLQSPAATKMETGKDISSSKTGSSRLLPPAPNTGTGASMTGVPFPNAKPQITTASETAERLVDLQKWKAEIRNTAKKHIEDMRLWEGQRGFPSLIQVANQAGVATVDAYRNNRVRQIIKRHYGVEMITAIHVPFRQEEKAGGRTLFLVSRANALRAQFYSMLEDLRDWEAITRWVEDPRSRIVRVDPDGTINADV